MIVHYFISNYVRISSRLTNSCHMRNLYTCVAILLLLVSSASAQSDGFKTPDWLEFVEEIRIPNDQYSGGTSDISIDPAGNVHFNANSTPHLFSRRLNQLIKLDPEGCRPGADPRLPNSWFTPDGEIVGNFGTSYFWFNLSGKCVHYVIDKTMTARFVAALPGRNMVFVRDYTNPYTIERMDATGSVALSAEIDKLPIANIASRINGGGVVFSNDRYYWANSMTNTVVAFDAKFSPIWRKTIGMENLPFFVNDITEEQSKDLLTNMPQIFREIPINGYIKSLSTIDRNLLVMHAQLNKEDYFQLFDHDGNPQKLLRTSGHFRHNPNSHLFYRVENEEELVLYVYRLK